MASDTENNWGVFAMVTLLAAGMGGLFFLARVYRVGDVRI